MRPAVFVTALLLALSLPGAFAQSNRDVASLDWPELDPEIDCLRYGPPTPPAMRETLIAAELQRIEAERKAQHELTVAERLKAFAEKHKLSGLASYYSSFFDGRQTANGEIYRNRQPSAAHLTLPLGSWIEVTCLATGKKIRLRVNDRGPYSGGFILDLSQAAARAIGVDRAEDRRVTIRVLALPGEEPPPDGDAPRDAAPVATAAN